MSRNKTNVNHALTSDITPILLYNSSKVDLFCLKSHYTRH